VVGTVSLFVLFTFVFVVGTVVKTVVGVVVETSSTFLTTSTEFSLGVT
jgi:hypothetical protein